MTYVFDILSLMPSICKPQIKAMMCLFSAMMCFSGRSTMRNLSRYGAGSEKRVRRWASKSFKFLNFNKLLLANMNVITDRNDCLLDVRSSLHQVIVVDATFLSKAGKKTEVIDYFYNGTSRTNNKIEHGLEMTLIGVINIQERSAYSLNIHQSNGKSALAVAQEELIGQATQLQKLSCHIVVDGAYSKASFINTLCGQDYEIIGALRKDSKLRYLYEGKYLGRGRPRLYDGNVQYNDLSQFVRHEELRENMVVYSKIVNYSAWKRNLLVVIVINKQGAYKVIYSTDLSLTAEEALNIYELRFQIEFLFRDAKQHTGLGHAQVLDSKGQEYFANASMSTLNILRLEQRLDTLNRGVNPAQQRFSIGSVKLRKYNEFMIKKFLSCLGVTEDVENYFSVLEEVAQIGTIAA